MSLNLNSPERIGRLHTLGDGRFRWTIDNVLSQVPIGQFRYSSNFKFLDRCYYVCLKKDLSVIYFFFNQLRKSPRRRLSIEMRIKSRCMGISKTLRGETDDSGYFSRTLSFMHPECKIFEEITGERFTLICTLRSLDVGGDISTSGEQLPAVKKLQIDLKNLLVSGEGSDVKIKVQGKEFPAHRNILQARSPVFNSMFSHDMVEKQSGVVVIDDCDPATFPDFLNYVYTGSTGHICDENVISLFTASKKYGVEELKEGCAAFMKSNMSIGTFCDVITLALRHGEKELVQLAVGFFCENAREIIKTTKWQMFLHENSTAGNELFIRLLSK